MIDILPIPKEGAKFCKDCKYDDNDGTDAVHFCTKVPTVDAVTGKWCITCAEARAHTGMCTRKAEWFEPKVEIEWDKEGE